MEGGELWDIKGERERWIEKVALACLQTNQSLVLMQKMISLYCVRVWIYLNMCPYTQIPTAEQMLKAGESGRRKRKGAGRGWVSRGLGDEKLPVESFCSSALHKACRGRISAPVSVEIFLLIWLRITLQVITLCSVNWEFLQRTFKAFKKTSVDSSRLQASAIWLQISTLLSVRSFTVHTTSRGTSPRWFLTLTESLFASRRSRHIFFETCCGLGAAQSTWTGSCVTLTHALSHVSQVLFDITQAYKIKTTLQCPPHLFLFVARN